MALSVSCRFLDVLSEVAVANLLQKCVRKVSDWFMRELQAPVNVRDIEVTCDEVWI